MKLLSRCAGSTLAADAIGSVRDSRTAVSSRRSTAGLQAIEVGQNAVTPKRGSRPAIVRTACSIIERVDALDAMHVDIDKSRHDEMIGDIDPLVGSGRARAGADLDNQLTIDRDRPGLDDPIGRVQHQRLTG